jgi:hypothetical protein
MNAADWIHVALCANRRKDYHWAPDKGDHANRYHEIQGSEGHAAWWREHRSERCAIEQAKRASALAIGAAGGGY